jgi:GT2 family glycosyltransferase
LLQEAHPTKVLMAWSYLFRRRLLEAVGPWDEGLHVLQDVEYMLRVTRSIQGYVPYIPQPLYFYRHHQDSRISENAKKGEGIAQRLHALGHIACQPYLSDENARLALRSYYLARASTYFRYGSAVQRAHFHALFRRFEAPLRESLWVWYLRARIAAQRVRSKGLTGLLG